LLTGQRCDVKEYIRIYHPDKCEIIPMIQGENPESDQDVVVTPEMIEAGLLVLRDLEGEVSRAFLAEAVYRAMFAESCRTADAENTNPPRLDVGLAPLSLPQRA